MLHPGDPLAETEWPRCDQFSVDRLRARGNPLRSGTGGRLPRRPVFHQFICELAGEDELSSLRNSDVRDLLSGVDLDELHGAGAGTQEIGWPDLRHGR